MDHITIVQVLLPLQSFTVFFYIFNWIITYLAPQNEAIMEARPVPEPTSSTDLSLKYS